MRRNLLLVDGHNFLWRAYGVPFKFSSSKGTPLHVATGFLSLLRRSAESLARFGGPSHLTVVFDTQEATSNHALSADYKSNRRTFGEDEDSPYRHLPIVKKILRHLRIEFVEHPGVEADDVIATLATKYTRRAGHRAVIASTDSDFYQLLSPRIYQLILGPAKTHTLADAKWVRTKLGVTPAKYVYFKSLVGDKADNIRGIPGVGPVRALKILRGEGDFEISAHAEVLALNRQLILLNKNAACRPRLREARFSQELFRKNKEIFEMLGF